MPKTHEKISRRVRQKMNAILLQNDAQKMINTEQ